MGGYRRFGYVKRVTAAPWEFLVLFLVVFFLSAVFLFSIDFVPEPIQNETSPTESAETRGTVAEEIPEVPVRIVVGAIGVDTAIQNPTTTDIPSLDAALLKGAVRYPTSALLGEDAPLFIFGHQSYLPVVRNQAFKAFNDLQKLKAGDEISIFSQTAEYRYRVQSVTLVEASEALIPLEAGARTLTLTTCNSFGEPTERYVVTADFVSRTPTL